MVKFTVIKKVITTQTYVFEVDVEATEHTFPTKNDKAISATNNTSVDAYDEERDVKFQVIPKMPGK